MTQSIELILDDATDAAVRDEWRALQRAGLPSMARHTGESNRPHITLGVATEIPEEVESAIEELALREPLKIRLGALMLFERHPNKIILVRLAVPSRELLDLQAEVADRLRGLPGTGWYLEPDDWTPHVTLANALSRDQLPAALEALPPIRDLEGHATALRRWDSIARRTWVPG